jgi:cobalt-zinc-cadmium efflux system outer membrane protein
VLDAPRPTPKEHVLRFAVVQSFLLPLVALPALLGVVASAQADEAPPDTPAVAHAALVTALLRDDRALRAFVDQQHSDLRAAEARVAQARADVGTARLPLPNPQLDMGVGGLLLGRPGGGMSYGDQLNFTAGITQTVELGKRGPRVDAAELRFKEAGTAYRGTLADRVTDARAALARVVYLKAKMTVLEDNLSGSRRVAELERARHEHGALSGNDFDRLLLDNISLETDIARSRSDFDGSLASCQAVLHAPCDARGAEIADLEAAAPLPAGIAALAPDIDKRPDVQVARLESAAAEQDAVLARRKAIPDPSFRLGYFRDNTQPQPNTLQVGVTIPLPLYDHGQHDAAKANARALEQRRIAEGLTIAARGALTPPRHKTAFLEAALQTLGATAVPKSTGVLDTTSKAFDQGQVSMTDLLLARRTHLSLVLGQMDLRFDYFSVRNDLRHTLGLDAGGR